jgi:Holliday junction resolvase
MGLEKKLEKRCCDVARAHGWYTRKFSSPSNRGVPDRIFVKDGNVVFIEFKAPGNKPTRLQEHEIKELAKHGANATWIDNIDTFKMRLGILT